MHGDKRSKYVIAYVSVTHTYVHTYVYTYVVASMRRLLKTIGLYCRLSSILQDSFAKETYNFKEPTNQSHPICGYIVQTCMGWL